MIVKNCGSRNCATRCEHARLDSRDAMRVRVTQFTGRQGLDPKDYMQAHETRFKDSMMMDECNAMSRKPQLHCQRGCDEPQTAAASLHVHLRSSYAGKIKYLRGTQWVPMH